MYSLKVMRLFKHPKNVGEIKDADGVGEAGNTICLPPQELVVTNSEIKEINSISVGEKVLGGDGEFHEVTAINSRQFAGELVVIKNCLGKTALTPEHKVLAVQVPKNSHYFAYTKNKAKIPAAWVEAGLLSKGDLCAYPIMRGTSDIVEIDTNVVSKPFDYSSIKIPPRIPVDAGFLRFAGYFLSNGSLFEKTTNVHAAFTFSSTEDAFAEDVRQIIQNLFGVTVTKKRIGRHTTIVLVNNAHIVRFLKSLFGNGAAQKAVPDFMMRLPPEKQRELLKGLWHGNGFLNKKIPRASYSTISRKLAEQIKMLLLRQGIVPSVYCEKEKTIKGARYREAYRIHVGRQGAEKIAGILGEELAVNKFVSIDAWVADSHAFVPIKSVAREFYEGPVYDLAVEDSHSFLTPSLAVHNCGDIMRAYIKVKGNKIVDAKFRTFGCVAAIATSSMVTELAKGKTLERALEITREEVAEAVGGLPPLKVHCSVLAVDALAEAIYDYIRKSGKQVPKELQARHERIRKEAKEVEERHKEYAELQRKAFKK